MWSAIASQPQRTLSGRVQKQPMTKGTYFKNILALSHAH